MPPEGADFAFTIDFRRSDGNPRRVFDAASALIHGFELLDAALASSVDESLVPLLVLEDVESGSLKVWLRNVLNGIEDDSIKKLDWKPIVGAYLLKAKYIVLEYCDSGDATALPAIDRLKQSLQSLAEQTDVRQLPAYPPIHDAKLIAAIDELQGAKRDLASGDRLIIESEGKTYEVDLSSSASPPRSPERSDERHSTSEAEMILTVRRPDFLKDSMWQFLHGKTSIGAPILDSLWLEKFHGRSIAIFPGDALRCRVRHTHSYDAANRLLGDRIEILTVLEVISGSDLQGSLFEGP